MYNNYMCLQYLYKGSKKTKVKILNIDDVDPKDEILMYVRGRYLCSMDAMWRTLKYQTYPSPNPTVNIIRVKMPDVANYFHSKSQLTEIESYFRRPAHLGHLLFTEFHNQFVVTAKLSPRFLSNNAEGEDYFAMPLLGNKQTYICKRSLYCITRMEMIYPTVGELFYLRELLRKRPAISFDDLLSFEGVVSKTFQQSAYRHGYLEDASEAFSCFHESAMFSSAFELRHLLAILTIQGFPTVDLFNTPSVFDCLTFDYTLNAAQIKTHAGLMHTLLNDLHYIFKDQNKTLLEYGYPEAQEVLSEVEREGVKYDPVQQNALLEKLQRDTPNNEEQEEFYQAIVNAIKHIETFKFFLLGQGGCGKTTLAKKVLAFTRSIGQIAVGCASTGLAATNYDDFYTAHGLLCYPVIEDELLDESEPAQCDFSSNEDRFNLLRATRVIIWDEMVSNHRELYEAAYLALDGFKGKILICMGDFRQIMPVIKQAARQEVYASCISSSHLWYEFKILRLTINMRLHAISAQLHTLAEDELEHYHNQSSYGDMILSIGEGSEAGHENADLLNNNEASGTIHYRLNSIPFFTQSQEQEAIESLYPQGFDSDVAKDSCILAATNDRGDMWNEKIQKLNRNRMHTLVSKDFLCDVDDPHQYLNSLMNTKALNSIKKTSIPENELCLKVGDSCLILRSLSRYGLATNTRVRILSISKTCIRVQTMSENPIVASIPRIRFKFKVFNSDSFTMTRIQFPLRLAYCMTYNKSQGQTLKRVLLDVVHPPFAHGHLYVALSRITNYMNIRLFCSEEALMEDHPVVASICFPELLQIM